MDTLAAISLATEPPSNDPNNWGLEERRKKDERIIVPVMWRNILVQVVYQLVILIVMLYSVPFWFGIGYNLVDTDITLMNSIDSTNMRIHYTILFNTFVLMNLFNQPTCRKLSWTEYNFFKEFFNNKWFLLILAFEFGLQWSIVEYFGFIFRTESL